MTISGNGISLILSEGDGDVIGPNSSEEEGVAVFSDGSGKALTGTPVTISGAGGVGIPSTGGINFDGADQTVQMANIGDSLAVIGALSNSETNIYVASGDLDGTDTNAFIVLAKAAGDDVHSGQWAWEPATGRYELRSTIGGAETSKAIAIITAGNTDQILIDTDDTVKFTSVPVLPKLTTTEVNALTPQEAMFVYDTTLNKLKFYNGAAWETVTSST